MEKLVIEKMKEADLAEVLAIENVSFPTPFTLNLFQMELRLEVAHLYTARLDGKLVGYIDYWRVGPEVHLITLAVHPEWRQKKIASSLVNVMLKDARENLVKLINLDVRPSNHAALALYEKFGFKPSGVRKQYYQDNQEDALVLSLDPSHELS